MNEYDGKEGKPPRRSVEQILRDSLPHPVRCAVVFLHTETFTRSFDFFCILSTIQQVNCFSYTLTMRDICPKCLKLNNK